MLIHMLVTVHGRQAHDRVGIDQSCAHQDNPCASCSESARDTPRVWGQLPRRLWFGRAEDAFRVFIIVAVVFLVVVRREPSPD